MLNSHEATKRPSIASLSKPVKGAALALAFVAGGFVSPAAADATDDIAWVLTVQVTEGQDEKLNDLMTEMVAATQAEVGAKEYGWYRNGDTVHIVERYESNADAGIHLGNFGTHFADRFLAIVKPTELQVYGPVEGDVREGLAGLGATFFDQVGGIDG